MSCYTSGKEEMTCNNQAAVQPHSVKTGQSNKILNDVSKKFGKDHSKNELKILQESKVSLIKQGPENYFLDTVDNYVVVYRPPKPCEYSSDLKSVKR